MKTFIIAEAGINHNGDIETAKNLIDVAKIAGADAIKFQKRTIKEVYTKKFLDFPRESPWGTTQRNQKEGLEFGLEEYKIIDKYCKEKEIDWFASAWDIKSQFFLRQFDLKYNKVASAMLIYGDLLREIASEGKYTFISTGMSTLNDISAAAIIFKQAKCPFELMHCVSIYPMDDSMANLKKIQTLQNLFKVKVGYSGHEAGADAITYAAVALGATSIERHITMNRAMYGSDQAASLEPTAFVRLVGGIRKIEQAFNDSNIEKTREQERVIAKKLRAHIK